VSKVTGQSVLDQPTLSKGTLHKKRVSAQLSPILLKEFSTPGKRPKMRNQLYQHSSQLHTIGSLGVGSGLVQPMLTPPKYKPLGH
jgi:hypothetical protein